LVALLIFLLKVILTVYAVLMLIYCLCGWYIRNPQNKFMRFLGIFVEPPLKPIRMLLMKGEFFRNSPVDFSPLILYLILQVIIRVIDKIA
jgi:YggT family protein